MTTTTTTPSHASTPRRSLNSSRHNSVRQRAIAFSRGVIKRYVDHKLGPYCRPINEVDCTLPTQLTTPKSVAVIGAGLAGLGAACNLAARGFHVTIFEKEAYLGGKVGAWKVGDKSVEHGFHAFFRQYYNLLDFLKRIDAAQYLQPISDYQIRFSPTEVYQFADVSSTPLLNLIDLGRKGFFSMREIFGNLRLMGLMRLLRYKRETTFAENDHITFQDFADRIGLSPKMRTVFNTFARAFFAEPDQISLAHLIKGMHYYFLSNDRGLLYDTLNDDFNQTLIQPIMAYLNQFNADLCLSTAVDQIHWNGQHFHIHNQDFDYCVLACHSVAAKGIIDRSTDLTHCRPDLANIVSSGEYAVLRLWMNKSIGEHEPYFVFTDRKQLLDSVTFYHHMEASSREWAQANQGGVYELHAYSIPSIAGSDPDTRKAWVREQLLKEFLLFYPQLKDAVIMDEVYQYRNDFTSFKTGLYANTAETFASQEGLYYAGDWVKLPIPATLMEAAYTSGAFASNAILQREHLQSYPLYSVPLTGMYASAKAPRSLP